MNQRLLCILCTLVVTSSVSADDVISSDHFYAHHEKISYHVIGQQPQTILLLAGGPGFTCWNLFPLQRQLAQQGFRVVMMDMRGVGEQKNLTLPQARLLDQWVEDIESLRHHLGVKTWIVAGHSWGGLMGLLYGKRYPAHVQRLLLINPVDPEKRGLADIINRINERQAQHNNSAWDTDWDTPTSAKTKTEDEIKLYQIQQVLPTYFADFQQGQHYAAQFTANDFEPHINSRIWQEYDAAPFTQKDAHALQNKTLDFIDCDQDLLMPDNAQGLSQMFPRMSKTVLTQCAHFPWIEQPEAFEHWLSNTLTAKE